MTPNESGMLAAVLVILVMNTLGGLAILEGIGNRLDRIEQRCGR